MIKKPIKMLRINKNVIIIKSQIKMMNHKNVNYKEKIFVIHNSINIKINRYIALLKDI